MVPRWQRLGFTALFSLSLLGACARSPAGGAGSKASEPSPPVVAPQAPSPAGAVGGSDAAAIVLRHIVKKGSLELEVRVASDAAAEATRIAESAGGFVVSSQREAAAEDGKRTQGPVTLTLRVPTEHFSAALTGLRRLGAGDGSENVTTEDVSEEYIDLDARIRNQRALEAEFLQLLKQASKIEEALNVQREVANVRTEIDRMEGRRRFLERETALSTITLTLVTQRPLVSASFHDFTSAVARAGSDTVNVGAGIVTAAIRVLGVLLPVALLFGLPFALGLRFVLRRARRVPAL